MADWWNAPTTKHAYWLSWISTIITVIAAVLGIVLYLNNGSSLILCYGLENCVDCFSSVIVLWRFFAPKLTDEVEEKLKRREKRASVAISIVLAFLGIGITVASIDDFVGGKEENENLQLLLGISISSILVFGLLTVVKFKYSAILQSASLHKDGICSLIGTILSTALFVNTLIIKSVPEAWWIDPSVALGCGIASFAIGMHSVVCDVFINKIPIYLPSWWLLSQGDGKDEFAGQKNVTMAELNTVRESPDEDSENEVKDAEESSEVI
mmetsp:Transcript_24995/g.36949  ORF Transcript_24995/g.36949 Transcript_24995/m.36949 type:complete len:268 (+) Transcript_24995:134-937(+)|eukprot:CAMPEP_0194206904 /NCGR_PEP_ID=MMETSP0156-20130528/5814_1 /TAXON_ID=33649 /ORGANISM="Thalassionema nitzschioides, Strain L26-B" /LENGTH=267 /DNA_ID=CAMNT_0038933549 /DNA_START=114 /DNA_END=917 /DNA_ORIENTATION=-